MSPKPLLFAAFFACLLAVRPAMAEELTATVTASAPESSASRAAEGVHALIGQALDLIGIRYRRGGNSADTGFDCSGFVGHVFRETLGLVLPRTAREISQTGAQVEKSQLQPGDLVFFNTMRRAFSHVGIYLGDNQFVHAPRAGDKVRVADIRESYWANRYNGARRVGQN